MADNGPKDTSLQSTKQMLDELDALMERMLSLPVSEQDEGPAPSKEMTRSPALAASLTLLEEPADPPAKTPMVKSAPVQSSPTVTTIGPAGKKPVERRSRTKPAHPPIKPPHLSIPVKIPAVPSASEREPESAKSQTLPFSPRSPEPLTNEVVPTTVASELDPLVDQGSDTPSSAFTGRRTGPLLWINQRFDRSTMFLGFVGQMLRGPVGRTMLGLSGVAFLLVAVGWVLRDWLGWNWQ